MDDLVLTDDEVVAVAADGVDSWPVDLPTVDTSRAGEVRDAVWRGRRSLAVRGLLDTGGSGADPLAAVRRDAVGARVLLGLHVGGTASARGVSSFVVNAFPTDTDWLVETVSDHGVHGFQHLDHDTVVSLVAGLAEQALERGVAGGGGVGRLWIGVVAEGRRPALRVGAGRAAVVEVEDGRSLARTSAEVRDVRAEVVRLVGEVRRLAGVSRAVAAGS